MRRGDIQRGSYLRKQTLKHTYQAGLDLTRLLFLTTDLVKLITLADSSPEANVGCLVSH